MHDTEQSYYELLKKLLALSCSCTEILEQVIRYEQSLLKTNKWSLVDGCRIDCLAEVGRARQWLHSLIANMDLSSDFNAIGLYMSTSSGGYFEYLASKYNFDELHSDPGPGIDIEGIDEDLEWEFRVREFDQYYKLGTYGKSATQKQLQLNIASARIVHAGMSCVFRDAISTLPTDPLERLKRPFIVFTLMNAPVVIARL